MCARTLDQISEFDNQKGPEVKLLEGKPIKEVIENIHDSWTIEACVRRYGNLPRQKVEKVFQLVSQLAYMEIVAFTIVIGDKNFAEMGPFDMFVTYVQQLTPGEEHTINLCRAARTAGLEVLMREIGGKGTEQIFFPRIGSVKSLKKVNV